MLKRVLHDKRINPKWVIKIKKMKYILIREVLQSECPWLYRNFAKGEIVYFFDGPTYNCISKNGLSFTEKTNDKPFFELPKDAVISVSEN